MTKRLPAALPPALLVAALAVTPAAARRADQVPVAIPDGKPQTCISLTQIRQSHVRSDRVIDFETRRRDRYYRVTLPYKCPGLGFEERFAYRTSLSQLCSTDIITVLQSTPLQRGASCGLAEFQPVTIPRARR